jgi:hypothetical protein
MSNSGRRPNTYVQLGETLFLLGAFKLLVEDGSLWMGMAMP